MWQKGLDVFEQSHSALPVSLKTPTNISACVTCPHPSLKAKANVLIFMVTCFSGTQQIGTGLHSDI